MIIGDSSLPRLGLGMAALGRPGYITLDRSAILGDSDARSVENMQERANLVLDRLFDEVEQPWIDCARSYGLSEKFTGEYLRKNNIRPDDVFVSSKWGYTYVADWEVILEPGAKHEVKDHSVQNFLKQVQETDACIGEYLNLYQIHSATFESGVMDNTEVHAALHQCRKDRGWAIGLSASSTTQHEVIRHAMDIEVDGQRLFDSIQCTYNIFEQRPGRQLEEAHKLGIDIVIKEGLANGRVLSNDLVKEYAGKLSCLPDQLALACILAQPFNPRVLSGAVTAEQLSSNLKALEVAEKLRQDTPLLREIMSRTLMDSDQYWMERSDLPWN